MPSFQKRVIYLRGPDQVQTLLALIPNLPLDAERPLQITIEEYRPARKQDQNALMWAGPLKDISAQAYVDGKRFTAEAWHEMFKEEFLPDEFDSEQCRDGYIKYTIDPKGNRRLIGSTTQLTVRGFSRYLEQVMAFAANLGVEFHEKDQS